MRTKSSRVLSSGEERGMDSSRRRSDVCKPTRFLVATPPGFIGKKDSFDETRKERRQRKSVRNPGEELAILRRFTCHEIQFKTQSERKENHEARKSVSHQKGVATSMMVRRNSRNANSNSACSGEAYDQKSTKICTSNQCKDQCNFTEIKLVEIDPKRKDNVKTNHLVHSVTSESSKETLPAISENPTESEFRAVEKHSTDKVSHNDVLDNPQSQQAVPKVCLLEPPSAPSRAVAPTLSSPQEAVISNFHRPDPIVNLENPPPLDVPNAGNKKPAQQLKISPARLPPTLQDTIVKYLLRRLGVAVWNWREDNPRTIETFVSNYRSVVPAHIRSLMLDCVQQEGRVWHTVTLRLLELLLGEDCTRSVRVRQVRVFYRDQFLACLVPLSRLTELRLEDPTWRPRPQHEALLCNALPRLQQLRILSLHYLATNAVVAAAVDSCCYLQVLDLFFSSAVTNKGAYWLLGRRAMSVQVACSAHKQQRRKRWYSSALSWFSRARGGRKRGRREVKPAMLGCRQSSKSQDQIRTRPSSENSTQLPSSTAPDAAGPGDVAASVPMKLLPCLRLLDLRGTSVSGAAVLDVRTAMPETKVLAIIAGSD